VAVAHLGALAEQCVGLVEQQDGAGVLGCVEQSGQVLLGLPDVLAHRLAEVDHDQVEAQVGGECLGREGLARPARAGEQRGGPDAEARPCGEAPVVHDPAALSHAGSQRVQLCQALLGEDEVVPRRARLDEPSQSVEAPASPLAHCSGEIGSVRRLARGCVEVAQREVGERGDVRRPGSMLSVEAVAAQRPAQRRAAFVDRQPGHVQP
jgi:hypothetical protein